ncbi:MAG: hypothetical protein IT184_00820 [Acidobacteria bacterium]|nr:hypothetical protein [Acidobacteriota bacterium]
MTLVKARPGRPKKFGRPARAITIRLPEDVLQNLASIDADLARAIVHVAERAPRRARTRRASGPAELTAYGRHAVIVVTPVRALKRLPGVELVPIGNGRALISLKQPCNVPQLELSIRDALEKGVPPGERQALEAVAGILRDTRVSRAVHVEERTIIVLRATRRTGLKRTS